MENWEQKILLKFSSDTKDYWTVDDAMKGTSIIGGTGSGKTSGSGKAIALKFLEQGWGGLVLCAKTDEAKLWQQYCKQAGRENDLIIFGKNSTFTQGEHYGKTLVFNALNYEMNRTGEGAGEAFNLTNIFMNLNKMRNRASNEGESKKDDMFWDNALKRIISRSIELINLAGENLTYANMMDLIYSAPTEKKPHNETLFTNFQSYVKYEDQHKNVLRDNYYLKCLAKAFNKVADLDEDSENCKSFQNIKRYFSSSLPNMSDNTHNAIIESFMGVVEPFLSGILNKHFSGETTLFPEEIYKSNKIIVLDFPVKEFLDAGIMAQSIFKLIFQQAIERRDVVKYPQPVFLWADEAQYFVNPYDQIFLTTARSSRTATVFLSQNISNYYVIMGSGMEAKSKVDSFMGNLTTKIFHANSDAATNEYASRLIGNAVGTLKSSSHNQGFLSLNISSTEGVTSHILPQVQAMNFTMLRSGGASNDFKVDAYLFITGKKWSTGTNYLETVFQQNFKN